MTKMLRSFVKPIRTRSAAALILAASFVALPGCTSTQLQGQSSSYLIVQSISAARGDTPDEDFPVLDSDVSTNGTIFADIANINLTLGMKDPGSTQNPSTPTSANYITVTRYHVKYIRSDGRNVQGVDVPYEFDAGSTATVVGTGTEMTITLVRVQAKLEAPLKSLVGQGGQVAITTTAEITLYGKDQAGRDVSVKGTITVNFADFG
jgi:hypothetical protein